MEMAKVEVIARNLNYLCKTYDGLNKLLVATQNRLHHLNPEADPKHQPDVIAIDKIKGQITRRIEKELGFFHIWTKWGKKVKQIGPAIMGHLVRLYYFKFIPICESCGADLEKRNSDEEDTDKKCFVCSTCGKKAKGEGVLKTRIEGRDFPNISCWWSFLGMGSDEDGRKPRKRKGKKVNYSVPGQMICYQAGEQFVKDTSGGPYRRFYVEQKAKREKTHPDVSKMYRHNMARHETAKLFLAHFWTVARTLDGKPVTAPYAETILGHTGIIAPFYWDGETDESQNGLEIQYIHASQACIGT